MSRAPGKYVAGTMAPAGAALDRPVVDSGSTCHMTNVKTDLTHSKRCTQHIKLAKKSQSMTARDGQFGI
jgi:hypothetical protein